MKSLIAITLLALASGCAANVSTNAPARTAKASPAQSADDDVVLPAYDSQPPGQMTFAWQPTAPPPAKKVRARKLDAKPHQIQKKRRLFALPK